MLCKIAKVSKCGYYKWWKNADKIKDESDTLLIAELFFKNKQKAGFRTIKMKLLQEYGIVMNHKKIIRIMKKYEMTTKIRAEQIHTNMRLKSDKKILYVQIWQTEDLRNKNLIVYMQQILHI